MNFTIVVLKFWNRSSVSSLGKAW